MTQTACEIILASGSRARRAMLEAAGIPHRVMRPDVDETRAKAEALEAEPRLKPAGLALHLARIKAEAVGRQYPRALVIGSDQVLEVSGTLCSKSEDRPSARRQLMALRGRSHRLVSAVSLVRGGAMLWDHADTATLTVRDFSESFLEAYLDAAGDAVLASVGCYEIEGRGVTLMDRIEGDHFTILGMPLLPLLAALRAHGAIPS